MTQRGSNICGALAATLVCSCSSQPLEALDLPGERPPGRAPDGELANEATRSALTCPELSQDENLCLVSELDGPLYLFGLESAHACPLSAFVETTGSLGWVDQHAYACDLRESLVKVSLVDGAIHAKSLAGSHVGCHAVTAWGPRLVLYGEGQISIFASFDDIPNAPIAQYQTDMEASRLAVANDVLLGAWHSTDQISVFDLASGTDLPAISLGGYDDQVNGLGSTVSGEIAMLVPDRVGGLQIRERQTGAIVRTVQMKQSFPAARAMTCGGASFSTTTPPLPAADPVIVQAECDFDGLSIFDNGGAEASGAPSLHVVSVYQPAERGVVNVHLNRPGEAILVLVAYEDTRWNVTRGPKTNLSAVTVRGYELQTLSAPAGVETDVESYVDGGAPALPYSYDWGSYEARRLRFDVEQMTHLPMRSYAGCYEGASFTID